MRILAWKSAGALAVVVSTAVAQDATQRPSAGGAAASAAPGRTATAVPARPAPVIDGRGHDAAWKDAPVIGEFVQFFPRPDEPTPFATEVRFAFDAHNLYILARMHDPAPDSIMARLGRRDVDYPADWFSVTIAGYNDRRTGQEFRVSAGGGLFDALRLSDGQPGLSPSWDGIWDAKVSIDATGWVAEMRIPFSQLRFGGSANPTFGLVLRRNVGRDDSEHAWPRIDAKRAFVSWISQGGELTGLRDVGGSSRLEVSPYLVATNSSRPSPSGWQHPTERTVGADLRYGVTPNVSVSATLNPDFGQVEADPATLNLSAYELFFAERRPFFLEGSSIFTFNAWCDNVLNQGCTTNALYTRRIGRAPQLAGRYGSASSPLTTRILGAAKVSGRVKGGTSFGLMTATTAREGGTQDRTIEPAAQYVVARALRELRGGRGEFGGLLTYVGRSLDEWTEPFLRREALVGGISTRRRFGRDLQLDAALLASDSRGSRAAITAMQRDGVHRFQRVGAGLDIDTTRTSLGGYSARLNLARVGGPLLWEMSYQALSPGFEMNDLGYMRRADMQSATLWAERATRNGRGWYRERFAGTALRASWTMRGLPIGRGDAPWPSFFHVYAMHRLQNTGQWNVFLRAVNFNRPVDDFVSRGGPALRGDAAYQLYSYWRSDSRRRFGGEAAISLWRWEQGHAGYEWLSIGAVARPTTRLQASVNLEIGKGREDQQWVSNRGVAGMDSTHYTFARLASAQVNPTLRLDWTMTPHLTFQWYAQPYLTGGDYADWRETAAPGAAAYEQRFRPFTGANPPSAYSVQQLRSNAVLRWEFLPGSILYAVWQQRRDGAATGRALGNVADAYGEMFDARPDNTFVLKVSYWFNP